MRAVRSTWAILCSNHKAVPSVHDVWRDPGANLDPVDALWIGRSVFPRKAPIPSPLSQLLSDDLQGSERMAHDEEGVDDLCGRPRHHLPRELDSRRNPGDNPGVQGGQGHIQGAERPGVDDFGRVAAEGLRVVHPVSSQSFERTSPKTHSRWDPSPQRGDREFWPVQKFHVPRLPEDYLSWAIRETQANDNSSDDLRRLAKWAETREKQKRYTTNDPEVGAKIPYMPSWASSSGTPSSWLMAEQMPVTPPRSTGTRSRKASPKSTGSRRPQETEHAEVEKMEQDAPESVVQEVQALQARLAGLMDRYNIKKGPEPENK